jgi:hypothetical protein
MAIEQADPHLFKTGGVRKILEGIARGILVEEPLNDPEIENDRRIVCQNCPHIDKKNVMCGICHCFLIVKTASLVNINPHTGESEITHCPKNFWTDKYSKSFFTNNNLEHDSQKV